MMAEDFPKKPSSEDVLGTFGVSSVRMDKIIIPGTEQSLDVFAERDEFGHVIFRSTQPHEQRPDNALFDGPIQPRNN